MKITTTGMNATSAFDARSAFDTAAACFGSVPSYMSLWAAPMQGIAMSTPAHQLGGSAGIVATVPANAAKGADRKRTAGDEAFEDPL